MPPATQALRCQQSIADDGVAVAFADLVLLGAEVQRFKQKCDLLQKANGGAGARPDVMIGMPSIWR